jgi:hypothetical protein
VQPRASQQLNLAAIDPGVHAVAVVFDFVQPALTGRTAVTELGPDQELRERIAQVVARVDRLEATLEREKADAEERAIARARAAAPKRRWWRLGR